MISRDVAGDRRLRDGFWHLVAHRCELAKPGSFVRLTWLGDDVVAYADQDSVIVFDNLCPHRGARMLDGTDGVSPLVCRYHGWAYRNGRVRVPPDSGLSAVQCDSIDLSRLKTAWLGDWLFASIAPERELSVQLAGVIELMAEFSQTIAGRTDLSAYTYECPWQIAVENALEPYHIAAVHPGSLGELRLGEGTNDLHAWSSVWRAPIHDERSNKRLRLVERLFGPGIRFEGYLSIYLFPFSMVSTTYGYSYSVQNFFPAKSGAAAPYG